MTSQEFKKAARLLQEAWKELEKEALEEGVDIFGEEYKLVQDKIREKILGELGFTLQEYREAKTKLTTERRGKQIDESPIRERIVEKAREIVKEIKPQIITKVIKETIKEKPVIVNKTIVRKETFNEVYDDSELKKEIENIKNKPEINLDEIKGSIEDLRGKINLEKDTNVFGMPDFRKLAMGLQGQIDSKSDTSHTHANYVPYTGATGSVDLGANSLTAAELTANDWFLVQNGGITWDSSGLNETSLYQVGNGQLQITNADALGVILDVNSIATTNKTFIFPNASGTLALTSDLAPYLTTATAAATYQPLDATLTALAGLTIAANSLTIGTGADAFSQTTFAANTFPARASTGNLVAKTITDFGLSLIDDADASAARTTLGLVIGTNVQAYDADLTTWAGITPGTGVGTALAVNVGTAGAFVVNGGALGTPSSGTLTNATGLPISTGVSGLGTNVAAFLATPSSANLAAAVTDETGTGALVFGTAPTFTTSITTPLIYGGTAAGSSLTLRGTSNAAVGQVLVPDGSVIAGNAPGLAFIGDTLTGFGSNGANLAFWESGVIALNIADVVKEFRLAADYKFAWSSATNNNAVSDASIYRQAAGVLRTGGKFITDNTIKVGGTADRATTEGTNHIDIFNGTAPVGTLANGISIYSSAGEGYMMDAAGNATLQTPHDKDGYWIYKSTHTPTGKVLKIDMEKMMKAINDKFGWDFVKEYTI